MKYLLFLLSLFANTIFAQTSILSPYPRGYFRDPLNIPIRLAGNFGELRPNHYHMGLDIKTNRIQNYSVFAAADGYIARVKIEPFGFGRAIYINHLNGYTTVYGHLNNFNATLEQYVKQQQYRLESWAVFLEIPDGLFPVKKGDFIAYSGTTGGSQAPHLHFEIRETATDINLNPLLFGLPVPDQIAPEILRLALYDRNRSIYEQSPKIIPVRKKGKAYVTAPALIITHTNKVSLAITSYDRQTGSSNLNGIYQAILYENESEQIRFTMDRIGYYNTRNLNAHIDYKTRANGGAWLQHLTELPGYQNSIYQRGKGNGVINLADGKVHNIKILVKDVYGNSAQLSCRLQYRMPVATKQDYPGKMFYPGMLNVDGAADCEFYVSEKGLYDSVHINYRKTVSANEQVVSAIHSIGEAYIPLQDSLVVRIKPDRDISPELMDRVVMQRFAGSKNEVLKVRWQRGWASAAFREFGNFQLVVDSFPPQISPVGWTNGADISKASRITIAVDDNLKTYKNFRAELDGKWLRFTNDKGGNFIYIFDENCRPGAHELRIRVEDEAGNSQSETFRFLR